MSGAGNDFVLFDKKNNPGLNLSPEMIRKICERRLGVGADGLILINDSDRFGFDMQYFNADGSTGSLCGNGARCALLYGFQTNRFDKQIIQFLANGVEYSGQVISSDKVIFNFNQPKNFKYNFIVKAAGQLINASFVDTGAPHIVIKISDVLKNPNDLSSAYKNIFDMPVYELGKEIRYSPDFAPDGVNVNFVDIVDDLINIRTYERGVENETLSCGTGSVAAALITHKNFYVTPPVKLKTKGGDFLEVNFKTVDHVFQDLSLTGPAEIVFKGELSI